MKNFAIVALLAATGTASAQYSFTGANIVESFDGLVSASSPFSASVGAQATVPGLVWSGAKIAGTGSTNMPYNVDNGGLNTGGLYNYGLTGNTDRALGAIASASNTAAFGVFFTNNSGAAVTEFTLSFNGEQYRSSTSTQNVLTFAWGTSTTAGVTDSNFLSSPALTAATNGDIVGQPPVAANGVLNPPVVTNRSVTISGLNVLPGGKIYVRWSDFNDVGNDAGLAIDNLTFSAVPTPGATALLGLAGIAALRRRRA
ncbi:MAG: hypothetical protein ACKVZJ_13265 [Phycisphaerales bacterium]